MEEQVLKLMFDYSKHNRMIDREYIDKLIDIVANTMELNDYVGDIQFKKEGEKEKTTKGKLSIQLANESDFADLTYNFINHDIIVYIDKIPGIYQLIDNINFDRKELPYFKTIFYTQRILHELIHANQEKVRNEENSLESEIIDSSIPKINISNNSTKDEKAEEIAKAMVRMIIYIQNYQYVPHERMAEIDSYQKLLDILSLSRMNLPNTTQYLHDNMLNAFIKAYENTFSPTIKFVGEIDKLYQKNSLAEFDWYDENQEICLKKSIERYSFEQRIRYGLPIEEQKKEKLLKKLHSSKYGCILEKKY